MIYHDLKVGSAIEIAGVGTVRLLAKSGQRIRLGIEVAKDQVVNIKPALLPAPVPEPQK